MNFQITLSMEHVNIILRALDSQPHGSVRQVIDYLIAEVNAQQTTLQRATAEAASVKPEAVQ